MARTNWRPVHSNPGTTASILALIGLLLGSPALAADDVASEDVIDTAVHATIESAAREALATLRSDRDPATRGRFRVGRILAVDGGFVWEQPERPAPGARPVVRLRSGPDHVATFLARARDGSSSDRALAREWQRREQAVVDDRDPHHRPLFVLTSAGRVIVYRQTTTDPTSTEIAAVR